MHWVVFGGLWHGHCWRGVYKIVYQQALQQ